MATEKERMTDGERESNKKEGYVSTKNMPSPSSEGLEERQTRTKQTILDMYQGHFACDPISLPGTVTISD